MSKQEDVHRHEKPLEKTREIDNETRILKKAQMKRKFNRNQKRITTWDIQLSSLTFLIKLSVARDKWWEGRDLNNVNFQLSELGAVTHFKQFSITKGVW